MCGAAQVKQPLAHPVVSREYPNRQPTIWAKRR
jgi:hypothetical protein